MLFNEEGQRYFGRITHGLEDLAWQDVREHSESKLLATAHRLLEFKTVSTPETLLSIRSLEDIFIFLTDCQGIGHTRAALTQLRDLVDTMDMAKVLGLKPYLKDPLKSHSALKFSITASFLGKRNYSRWEIADTVGAEITKKFGWNYVSLEEPVEQLVDIHFRIHIEGERALVGIRLGQSPLYKRAYKLEHAKGSLNPCVAYLMTTLARGEGRSTLLDVACGVGTIPLEAVSSGWKSAVGGDIDPEIIEKAKGNAAGLSDVQFITEDFLNAGVSPYLVDAIVSDLPWGNQTHLQSDSNFSPATIVQALIKRTAPKGCWVLMSENDDFVAEAEQRGMRMQQKISVSLFGRHPAIFVFEDCGS